MPGHIRTSASLKDVIGDGKTHILIRTRKENIEHKYKDTVGKTTEKGKIAVCFWTMKRPPKMTMYLGSVRGIEGNKIMFTDGINVVGEGKILEINSGEIIFTPLKRVCYPQPKKAPTRGFTYV